MKIKLKKMREDRQNLILEARGIIEKAESENRERTADEDTRYDKLMNDFTSQGTEIAKQERLLEAEEELRGSQGRHAPGSPPTPGAENREVNPRGTEEYRASFRNFLTGGTLNVNEIRAMQADSDTGGGYLVAAEQFVMEIIKNMDNLTFIRKLARKFPLIKSASLGAPKLDTDPADADWTAELKTGTASAIAIGKRELRPHPLAKQVLISNTLLRLAAMDFEAFVQERLSYIFGITQEKAFLNGNGSGQPLGLFTASPLGISTNRDFSTGNKATSIQVDGLIEAKYAIKGQYWARLQWILHRDAVKQVAKLKDGEGQYIWNASIIAGNSDTLLGFPINMSEYAPNTFTTGQYVGMLGDYSQYWIADALDMQVQRLVELYALTNQTGYVGRMETDGMPVLEEAFARVKLA